MFGFRAGDDGRVGSGPKDEHTLGVGIDEPVLGDAKCSIVVRLSHEIEPPGTGRQHLDNNRREPRERRWFTRAGALLNREPCEVGLIAAIVHDLYELLRRCLAKPMPVVFVPPVECDNQRAIDIGPA